MKRRMGFVSNSSSSSFVCDISGETTEAGYDSYSELGICTCKKRHNFFFGGYPKVEAWLTDDENDQDGEQYYEVPEDICPVCNGEAKVDIVRRLKTEMSRLNIAVKDLE